jgi:phosphoribosylanthranilate isomerase
MMVKICGITNPDDARAAEEAGASALGFNFYPKSPRYLPPERAADLAAAVRTLKVGIFVDESPIRVAEIAAEVGLDAVQLHGSEDPADFHPLRVWKAFRVDAGWTPDTLRRFDSADAFLLDGPAPGTGAAFDWRLARNLPYRIILAGGLGPDNVAAAIQEVHPWGVDACSRLERAPGLKDHHKMRRFVAAATTVQI